MQKIQIKYGVGNVFDYLPDYMTTVNVVLDSINFGLNEFSNEIENTVKKIDKKHAHNDDFFNTNTNQVVTLEDVCKKYDLEIVL